LAITIKICGVTNANDAQTAASAGAGFVGLNFYEKSKRFVSVETAKLISQSLDNKIQIAGVFVNATTESIVVIADEVQLTHVQLHGDESPEQWKKIATRLPDVKLIRAIRVFNSDWTAALEQATTWKQAGAAVLLFDAGSDADYGGTGEVLNWKDVTNLELPRPWWLAGGLTPDNVATAIELAKPDGVDVASGVESAPGSKDVDLVRDFLRNATKA